jgi:hypothetical protein
MMETTTVLRVAEADVSHERLDGEVIAIHRRTGRYYSMSGAAADCWTLLVPGVSVEALVTGLRTAFGSDAVSVDAVRPFLDACLAAGLVEPVDTGGAVAALPDDYARETWVDPFLEEFDDMQDLILVDPVHDTSELGWPHAERADG